MTETTLDRRTLVLHPTDDVAVAREDLAAGTAVETEAGAVTLEAPVPRGHKVARRAVAAGQPVRKYGQVIGFATAAIAAGDHVHVHNLGFGQGELSLTYEPCVDARPVEVLPEAERGTFLGYARADGRVGTRNHLAVIATSNCAASVVSAIARRFEGCERSFANFDGVIALTHKGGCGGRQGWETELLQRTIAGFAKHPNVAAYVLVGLGCEGNQMVDQIERGGLLRLDLGERRDPPVIVLQESGGSQQAIDQGVAAIESLLPLAAACRRTRQTADKLVVGLQCGGSDALSGLTANPALGAMADELVRHGGTPVLSETPEIYGAEHLLVRRAVSREVADKLLARVQWWREYTAASGWTIDNNPAPGNKAGGLTTIFEKSLGAVAKAGTSPLMEVYEYAERITTRGLVHMDTPGYDPVSATGQVAGGCNLIVFTTGRGSCFGFKPTPVLKIATNTPLYDHMRDDMDLNAGTIMDGSETIGQVGRRLFDRLLTLAGGEASKSELLGVGAEEFNPWLIGPTM